MVVGCGGLVLPVLLVLGALGSCDGFRVTVDLNTYTSHELAYAAATWTRAGGVDASTAAVDGTWSLVNNSRWNGTATAPTAGQWRAALAAIGTQQFSEQMWPCSAADNARWNCSGIAKPADHSAGQCGIVRRLSPGGGLSAAFAYHETGSAPHTMLSMAEITAVSAACGGCGVLGHARLYKGSWKVMVDAVLGHPKLLGVAIEIDLTKYAPGHPVFGSAGPFARALLAAGKQPFFLLPLKADGQKTTGMPAAQQMRAFLRNATAEVGNATLLDDARVNVVVARYGHGGLLPVYGAGAGAGDDDTVASAVSAALQVKHRGQRRWKS